MAVLSFGRLDPDSDNSHLVCVRCGRGRPTVVYIQNPQDPNEVEPIGICPTCGKFDCECHEDVNSSLIRRR